MEVIPRLEEMFHLLHGDGGCVVEVGGVGGWVVVMVVVLSQFFRGIPRQ